MNNFQSFTRPLGPPDWTKFLKYSAFVRELGIYRAPTTKVMNIKLHQEAIKHIIDHRPTVVLFPHVYELNWDSLGLDPEILQYLLSMIGDRLRTIWLSEWPEGEDAEHILVDCLSLIESRSSKLQSLRIDADIAEPITSMAISSLVCNLVALRSIDTMSVPISAEAAMALCRLPTLHNLHVWLSDGERWPRNWTTQAATSPVLYAHVLATTETYCQFSSGVSFPKMCTLILKIMDDPGPIPELITAVRRQCSPESIRSLDIGPEKWGRLPVASQRQTVVRSKDFQPLFDLRGLTYFSFSAECRHDLDEPLFTSMAKAWPKLETLYVSHQTYCFHLFRPSIQTLIDLAVHAPQLIHLGLQFDADDWRHSVQRYYVDEGPPEYQSPTDSFFGELAHVASMSQVVKLDLGRSPIFQPHTVAYILARIFPKLKDVWPGAYKDADETPASAADRERWCEVMELLPLFLKVRRDERRRVRQRIRNGEKVEDEEEEVDEDSSLGTSTYYYDRDIDGELEWTYISESASGSEAEPDEDE